MTISIASIKAALQTTPWARQWTNPHELAWYEWPLGARNQGPRLAVRLVCPVIPAREDEPQPGPFRVLIIRSPLSKRPVTLRQLRRINQSPGWEQRIEKYVVQAWTILRNAPDCPACRSAMYPNKSKKMQNGARAFFSCCKWPACKGSRRITKIS